MRAERGADMKRKIDAKLQSWKSRTGRKPLMLFGARQTGKTTSVLEFGAKNYESVVHVDFYRQPFAKAAFGTDLRPASVVANLEALLDRDIAPGKTLLFLDEIQACDEAITALKFFCTDMPSLDVIAAGSLLGVHVAREGSFPVGYVDMLTMHPMDFEEFAWAHGKERAFHIFRQSFESFSECAVHEQMEDLYRDYLLVGGMPEAVKRSISGVDLSEVREVQRDISVAYVADMAKYATTADSAKIVACWDSIPSQLAKESGSTKFAWKLVASGAKAERYGTAVAWLVAAGLVNKCTQIESGLLPLKSFENPASFKLYMADTGLLSCAYDATAVDFLQKDHRTARFRGGMAENYVMQQLVSNGAPPCSGGLQSAQGVEFVIPIEGSAIPVEVKSGTRVKAVSANRFAEKYDSRYVIHLTAKNFGATEKVRSIPLYAACLLGEAAATES